MTNVNSLPDTLLAKITPTDEAVDAYDKYLADGGKDDFVTWNDKCISDYINDKLYDFVPLNFASLPFDEVMDAYYEYQEDGGKDDFPTWEDKCIKVVEAAEAIN